MKPIPKKLISISLIIVIFLGLFLVNVEEVRAAWFVPLLVYSAIAGGGLFAFIKLAPDVMEGLLGQVVYLMGQLAGWLMGIMGGLFNNILELTTEMLKQRAVYDGWIITRDIVNMFFILGLVVIAFATILRIETYGMKTLLPKLIIIALLINFSYLACGIIIDAANVITEFFVDQIKAGDTEAKLGVGGLMSASLIEPEKPSEVRIVPETDTYGVLIAQLVDALIHFLAGFVLLIGAVLLVVRMAGLWFLIILVPFAWFFSIFPALKEMNKKWWDNFLKYAFFAPIYVFFIYLSIRLINVLKIEPAASNMSENFSLALVGLTQFVIALVLLGGAPIVAMSMGVHGSQAVTTFAKGALKGTTLKPLGTALRGAGRWVGRQAAQRGVPTPKVIRESWKERREAKEKEAYSPAIAKFRDTLNRVLDRTKTFETNRAEDRLIDEKREALRAENLNGHQLALRAEAEYKTGNIREYKAALLEGLSKGNEKDLMKTSLGAKYDHVATPENIQQLLKDTIKNEQEAKKIASQIAVTAKATNRSYLSGLVRVDSKGELAWSSPKEMGEKGAKGAMSMYAQERWRKLGAENYVYQDASKNWKLTTTLKEMLLLLDKKDAELVGKEMPAVTKRALVAAEAEVRKEINQIAKTNRNQAAIVENWFTEIKKSV